MAHGDDHDYDDEEGDESESSSESSSNAPSALMKGSKSNPLRRWAANRDEAYEKGLIAKKKR